MNGDMGSGTGVNDVIESRTDVNGSMGNEGSMKGY